MAVTTVVKTIGTTGTFSTPQLWEDGCAASLTTAERSAANTFTAGFVQGEALAFSISLATGVLLDTDGSTFITYGITTGNPGAADVVTGAVGACTIPSGTPDFTGVIWQGQCQNQEFVSAASACTFGGVTTSATAYLELTTVAGASFRDHANVQTNALRYNAANGAAIRATNVAIGTLSPNATPFTRINKLQVSATGAGSFSINMATTSILVEHCICEGTGTAAGTAAGAFGVRGFNCIVKNTAIIQRATGADHIVAVGTGTGCALYNCTFSAADDLATAPLFIFSTGASGSCLTQNCGMFAGAVASAIQTGTMVITHTTGYTDTNTPPAGITQATYSSEFQDVNDATRDFRLKPGAAQIDTGTTDAVNAPIDIAKTTRPQGVAYDVGCWELIPVPSSGNNRFSRIRRRRN